jgi:hypothetical protein
MPEERKSAFPFTISHFSFFISDSARSNYIFRVRGNTGRTVNQTEFWKTELPENWAPGKENAVKSLSLLTATK